MSKIPKPVTHTPTHRSTPTTSTNKNGGSKSAKSVGGTSGGTSTSKGSGQVKAGTHDFSVDHVDGSDPDRQRGNKMLDKTGPQTSADSLASATKRAVGKDGSLRRADKSKKSSENPADDDDDGMQLKNLNTKSKSKSKTHATAAVKGAIQTKPSGKKSGGGGGGGGAGKIGGAGKAAKRGHARVERKSADEQQLNENESVSTAVESSGRDDARAGKDGDVDQDGGKGRGDRQFSGTTSVEGAAIISAANKHAIETADIPKTTAAEAKVKIDSPSTSTAGSGETSAGELARAGETHEVKDATFKNAADGIPKGDLIDIARGPKVAGLEKKLDSVAQGQLESDSQGALRTTASDHKQPHAKVSDNELNDLPAVIAEDGDPIDGTLATNAERGELQKNGAAKYVHVSNNGSRRGIDAPVISDVEAMGNIAGKNGLNTSDIALDTRKAGTADEGDGDEGEIEEEEEDGEED